jgi:predicted kinase
MMEIAEGALTQGGAVVVDAVFDRRIDRERIAEIARGAGVPFCGLWLQAPEQMLVQRVVARRGDPSDATPDVVMAQVARQGAAMEWTRIPAQEDIGVVASAALAAIGSDVAAQAAGPEMPA